jgi:FAD/FMN-containing dehydrogenase
MEGIEVHSPRQNGQEAVIDTESLRAQFRGELLQPGSESYEAARQIWNGMIQKRPAVIARCTGAADVMAAVEFARQHELPLAVRGGGHNVAGNALCDGGVVIDLAGMRAVRVDQERGVVRVGGGARLGDVDHETQAFGLAAPFGAVSTTGVAGLTLHGGLGFLMRKHGLSADNLLSADVVTASGELITARENNHPDLLWALRGGGGNFGVVTSFEFRLHPVGPEVWFMLVLYPYSAGKDVLQAFRALMPGAPDELMALAMYMNAPLGEPVPPEHWGAPVLGIAGCWSGSLDEAEQATRPLRQIAEPIADLSGPIPYVEMQRIFDPDYPPGERYYWKSLYLPELGEEAIELAHQLGAERPTTHSTVEVWALGGAIGRVPPEATAFYQRRAPWLLTIEANWSDPTQDEAIIAWVRQRYEDALQFSEGGTYFNFAASLEGGEDLLAKSFGPNYARLREIKARYDPDNLFPGSLRLPVEKRSA